MTIVSPFLPGTFNSRDLGGLSAAGGAVRGRTVLRSDVPLRLGEAGRAVLQRLGLRAAIDLREPIEVELDPADLAGLGIDVRHQPILRGFQLREGMSLVETYRELLDSRGEELTGAVRVFAEPDTAPALIFCSAGKDRTGLVVALLLGALGVPDDQIVADFARTGGNMNGEFRAELEARAVAAGVSEQQLPVRHGAPTQPLRELLAWLRESRGGAARYLLNNGLSRDELDQLRRVLLEPRGATVARCQRVSKPEGYSVPCWLPAVVPRG